LKKKYDTTVSLFYRNERKQLCNYIFQPKQFLTMSTNSFQHTAATHEEVLNMTSMLQIKGGTDDKRASRPVKNLVAIVRTTNLPTKKP
jgi:hypothetical protein